MAKYVIRDTTLTAIGDAIREQTGKTDLLSPAEMVDDINTYLGDIKGLIGRTLADVKHDGVEYVAPYAFYSYSTLNSIELPNCISIGSSAFSGCTRLTSISFPACTSVANINAFTNCKSIANVTLGYESFPSAAVFPLSTLKATTLATITFPKCSSIGSAAFQGYTKLKTVSAPVCETLEKNSFNGCTVLDTVYFPECTIASTDTFTNCKVITSATLGFTELTSDNNPLKPAMSSLNTINFPKCSIIGKGTFSGSYTFDGYKSYYGIKNADFPVCTQIGDSAFFACPYIKSISFPECSIIGNYAFGFCDNLVDVNFPECTIISYYAFANCGNIQNVSFPACISIGPGAFGAHAYIFDSTTMTFGNQNNKLTTVNFPNCLVVGGYAFDYCIALTTATFPVCQSIGSGAFHFCEKLEAITIGTNLVAELGSSVFDHTPIANSSYTGAFGSIYVPASLVDAYKIADNWSVYADRITAIVE